ncbi:folate-sensitive fragile site protein Fra10Ac1-domain-containing protein [Cunninghamella echinulata]|nr:folate-sensitive fragile site protein Fra10Ac1-domain-containing protein [Cunninghamella echinulata]
MKDFVFRKELNGVDAYTRHKKLVQDYARYHGKVNKSKEQSYNPEHDILRKHHRFIQTYDGDKEKEDLTWEERIAKKYYDQLFKEYALCDLSYYKQGKIALRWRTENEVILGKGQFICASTRCDMTDPSSLTSWEVNFAYFEDDMKKNELVKVRLCKDCSYKLNYKTQKRMAKQDKKTKKTAKRLRHDSENDEVEDDISALINVDSEEDSDQNDHIAHSSKGRKKRKTGDTGDQEESSSSIWSKPLEEKEEKSKEEEFEDYFADLLQ